MSKSMKIFEFTVKEIEYLKQIAKECYQEGYVTYIEREELDSVCRLIDLLFTNHDIEKMVIFGKEELEVLKEIHSKMAGEISKYHNRMNEKYDKYMHNRSEVNMDEVIGAIHID